MPREKYNMLGERGVGKVIMYTEIIVNINTQKLSVPQVNLSTSD